MKHGLVGQEEQEKATARSRAKRATWSRQALARRYATNPDAVKRFEARMARLSAVRRRANAESRWCILRTSGRATLTLSDSLEDAGFDVWTPVEITEKRIARTRERIEKLTPIMPGFVFASYEEAADLLRLSQDPLSDHDEFSLFHHHDKIPSIKDAKLDPLRTYEATAVDRLIKRRRRSGHKAEPFTVGEVVKIGSGAFGGLSGEIETSDARYTIISFGMMRVKMDTFILRSDLL